MVAVRKASRGEGAIRSLRTWIHAGRFASGQELPTEQALATELKVSRGTVRMALQHLREKGLVQSGQGRRHRVVSRTPTSPLSALMANTILVLCDPYFSPLPNIHTGLLYSVDSGIQDAIGAMGSSMLRTGGSFLSQALDAIAADPPRGVLVTEFAANNFAEHRLSRHVQLARLDSVVNTDAADWHGCDRVVSDHEAGSFELTQWLLARGHRRILPLWTNSDHVPETYWIRARNAGYERAMREAGLPPLAPLFMAEEKAKVTTERLLAGYLIERLAGPEPVDAILLDSDWHAGTVAAACRICGKDPNRDVAIAGYDNVWESLPEDRRAGFSGPVATVDRMNYEVGGEMVRMLTERAAGQLPPERQCRKMKPRLVVREEAHQWRGAA